MVLTVTLNDFATVTKSFTLTAIIYACEVNNLSKTLKYMIGTPNLITAHATQVEAAKNLYC